MMRYLHLLSFLCVAGLTACSGGTDKEDQSATLEPGAFKTGLWSATVTVPGGDIHFSLALARAGDSYDATLINGDEQVRFGDVRPAGENLTLFFPAFNSTIEAALDGGALAGTLTLVNRDGVEQTMPFRAEYAQGYTFSISGPDPDIDVTGKWDVTFLSDDGGRSRAIGEFVQEDSKLKGTFHTPTGDYRYLSGSVEGDAFDLSCFDGTHAFLFKGRLGEDGRIEGDFWSGTRWHERWRATRDDDAILPNSNAQQ